MNIMSKQPGSPEKQKSPRERTLRADQLEKSLTKSIPQNPGQHLFVNPIFHRFFNYLLHCGGCIGLRNHSTCRYALVCAYVEKKALIWEGDRPC